MRSAFSLIALFLTLTCGSSGFSIGLDELQDDAESETSLATLKTEWSGLLDMRIASHGNDRNWADPSGDYGGRGLTRFGGDGTKQGIGFHLGQMSLVSTTELGDATLVELQMNVSDHRDSSNQSNGWGSIGLAEGYVKERFSKALSARLGFLIPPISTEHPEVAWSTRYTITPSAINTWVGEEIRVVGLELTYKPTTHIELSAAPFSHNDSVATLLVYRGWALHDYQGTYGARLRWNKQPDSVNHTGGWASPFKELDSELGYYGRAAFVSDVFKTAVFYYDNRANPGKFDGSNYGWDTQFLNLSVEYSLGSHLTAILQGMSGRTNMGPDVVSADFHAAFFLLSYQYNTHRVSGRYDQFLVEDKDSTKPRGGVTDDESRGRAWTLAYMLSLTEMKTIGVEYVGVESERNGNEGAGDDDPEDDLYQIMYRLTF